MSSNPYRNYYYTSKEPSTSRPPQPRESLPSIRSVLAPQLDLPVRRDSKSESNLPRSGPYDSGKMGRDLPSHPGSLPDHGAHSDRGRGRGRPEYREGAYTFPPSTHPIAARDRYEHSYSSSLSNENRQVDQRYADPGCTSSSYSDPHSMDRGHGNKKYRCTWPGCEKRFERQNALDTHMNIHTDQKPFGCPVANCGKMFNVRSNMRRHLLTHKDYQGEEDEDRPVSSRSSKGHYYAGY